MSMQDHSTAPGANVIVEHYCTVAGCGKWGGFGFSSGKSVETRSWCWEHYPHKEPSKGPVRPQ
jgi:hypothetical protein